MLLTHMIDKIRPVRDSPPRQYATHPPLIRTRGGVRCRGGGGGGGGPYWNTPPPPPFERTPSPQLD